MKERLILTDADGVLLEWYDAFIPWMQEHGFILSGSPSTSYNLHSHFRNLPALDTHKWVKRFNESAAIGFLPSFRDSAHYVKRLHEEHGYKFHVITSLGTDKYAGQLRVSNLKAIFGDAIDSVVCLGVGARKRSELEKYKDSGLYWIEDHVVNATDGLDLGLRPILMEHEHNINDVVNYPKVKNWKDIYEIIVNQP